MIDIGGGSTEFVVGRERSAGFHVSLHAGVVRMSERHIHSDPPAPERAAGARARRRARRSPTASRQSSARPSSRGIAVAGTATSAAAIEQELDPYDPSRVHGYQLLLATVELLLARLADMNEAERREVVGLHPDRAPTIVAGMILLGEALRAFDLERDRGLRARHPLRRRAAPRRRRLSRLSGRSGEVRFARVGDARVGQHVHERRLARRERALERRAHSSGRSTSSPWPPSASTTWS